MKLLLYGILVVLVLLAPVKKQDVGDLEPIQAVWLYTDHSKIVLQTDTDDSGIGDTVEQAIADMKKKSEGVVYLDTAQFLLVSEVALEQLDAMKAYLKDWVKVCLWDGSDVKTAARYMQSHHMGTKIKELSNEKMLQELPKIVKKGD